MPLLERLPSEATCLLREKKIITVNVLLVRVLSLFSRVWLCATLWIVVCQAPLSVEFSRQEYWSGSTFPSPGNLLDPGFKPGSPTWQADSLPSEPPGKPSKYYAIYFIICCLSHVTKRKAPPRVKILVCFVQWCIAGTMFSHEGVQKTLSERKYEFPFLPSALWLYSCDSEELLSPLYISSLLSLSQNLIPASKC